MDSSGLPMTLPKVLFWKGLRETITVTVTVTNFNSRL